MIVPVIRQAFRRIYKIFHELTGGKHWLNKILLDHKKEVLCCKITKTKNKDHLTWLQQFNRNLIARLAKRSWLEGQYTKAIKEKCTEFQQLIQEVDAHVQEQIQKKSEPAKTEDNGLGFSHPLGIIKEVIEVGDYP